MSKGKKTCSNCGFEFAAVKSVCPECKTPYSAVFHMIPGETLICLKPKIAVSRDTYSLKLRFEGKPPTYHSCWASIQRELGHALLKTREAANLAELVKIERDTAKEVIRQCGVINDYLKNGPEAVDIAETPENGLNEAVGNELSLV